MGPVNWIAVGVAWLAAAALSVGFYGRGARPRASPALTALAGLLLLFTAAMMGHMFARVGSATLAAKPWLYPMMSGGLALTFVGPALVVTAVRRGLPLGAALFDWGYVLAAYLAMGAAFWALG